MPDSDRSPPEAPTRALADLLAAMRASGGLPSVGHTLARLTRLLESDDDAVQVLADVILADVALTQRLLRLANTVPYRSGPQAVTTVTRAIMLLGFDQVRSTALSAVLIEGLLGGRAPELRTEFHQSLLAGSLARELLRGSEAEEASIGAMFRGVGRLLVAVYAPQTMVEIRELAQAAGLAEGVAARRVLGRNYDELSEQVLRDWSVPDRIVSAVQPLPQKVPTPVSAGERVRAAAQFADAIAAALAPGSTVKLDDVLERFKGTFDIIDHDQLVPLLERAGARTREFEVAFNLKPGPCPVQRFRDTLPGATSLELDVACGAPQSMRDAVGRPTNACSVLAAGLAEATDVLGRGSRIDINAVIQVTLEAMYTGLGYARTALALRDPASGLYRTRAGFGEPKAQFGFSIAGASNLFAAALARAKDLHIADSRTDKLRANLPEWFTRDFAQAASFLVMPVVVNDKVIGFFYADRPMPDPQGLTPEELNLLRALRSQVVLAIRSR